MSVLDRFEKSVEGAVNGVFAKFGSKDLQPVDLSSALEREIDAEAMPVGRDRTVAPNEYRFKLSTPDFDRIEAWGSETLANVLYISKCCLRPLYDEYGNVYIAVDMELKGRIREALIKMMLDFDIPLEIEE